MDSGSPEPLLIQKLHSFTIENERLINLLTSTQLKLKECEGKICDLSKFSSFYYNKLIINEKKTGMQLNKEKRKKLEIQTIDKKTKDCLQDSDIIKLEEKLNMYKDENLALKGISFSIQSFQSFRSIHNAFL